MASKVVKNITPPKTPIRKRTSIGLKDFPRNKKKKRSWKKYRGQGRP